MKEDLSFEKTFANTKKDYEEIISINHKHYYKSISELSEHEQKSGFVLLKFDL